MEIQGRIIAALPERSGVSQRGEWKTQDFVIETHDAYPKKMVFNVFGSDRLERFRIQVGQEVMVSFDIDAHEYQGRWYNTIRAYDVRLVDPSSILGMQQPQAASAPFTAESSASQPEPFPPAQTNENSADDLPF